MNVRHPLQLGRNQRGLCAHADCTTEIGDVPGQLDIEVVVPARLLSGWELEDTGVVLRLTVCADHAAAVLPRQLVGAR